MKKINYYIISLLFIFLLLNINIIINSTKYACVLFFNKVFVTIFPFILLSDILIYFNYHIFLKNTLGKYISKLFNIDSNASIVIILSILTSQPNNSIYIKDMLDKKLIDLNTANRLLCFTYFPSISFVIGTIGIYIYNSFIIGLIIYLICFFYNFLIGLYLRKEKKTKCYDYITNKKDFFKTIKESIIKGINSSFVILGILIIFTIIINLLSNYITNKTIITFLSLLFEITNGITKLSNLNINFSLKIIFTIVFLSFSSLSILFQSFSILNEYKINIKRILIIKLIFSIFLFIILTILYLIL